jgi:hypothetical protein
MPISPEMPYRKAGATPDKDQSLINYCLGTFLAKLFYSSGMLIVSYYFFFYKKDPQNIIQHSHILCIPKTLYYDHTSSSQRIFLANHAIDYRFSCLA